MLICFHLILWKHLEVCCGDSQLFRCSHLCVAARWNNDYEWLEIDVEIYSQYEVLSQTPLVVSDHQTEKSCDSYATVELRLECESRDDRGEAEGRMKHEHQANKSMQRGYGGERGDGLFWGAENCNSWQVSFLRVYKNLNILFICQNLTSLLFYLLFHLFFSDIWITLFTWFKKLGKFVWLLWVEKILIKNS